MTDVGRRPTLQELIAILGSITQVGADDRAMRPDFPEFSVVLTFSREKLHDSGVDDWVEGQPKPTWLFQEIREQLWRWATQQTKEQQWASKEDRFGASIEAVMAYWTEELKRVSKGNELADRVASKFIPNTILRLQELLERRKAGGVCSETESRREKARKSWMEDEYEAPKREEEQRKQREKTNRQQSYESPFENTQADWRHVWEEMHRAYTADRGFEEPFWSNFRPDKPQPAPHKKPWYVVLGVAAGATETEIQKAHRRLAKQYHPDRYKGVDANERMTEINVARDEGLLR